MKFIPLFCLIILFSSCLSEQSADSITSNESSIADSTITDTLITLLNSDSVLVIGIQKFSVNETSDKRINQGVIMNDWPNEDSLLQFYPGVNRIGDSLIFETSQNGFVVIEDVPMTSDDDFNIGYYSLRGDVSGSDYWELFAMGYEYHWSMLVSKKTGKTTRMIGRPMFSPDDKYMITGNVDLEAAFTDNGFEFFECKGEEFVRLGFVDPLDWGPYSLKWISNDAILVTAGSIDYENDYEMSYKNVVLTLID